MTDIPASAVVPSTAPPAIPLGAMRAIQIFLAYLGVQFLVGLVAAFAATIYFESTVTDATQVGTLVTRAVTIPASIAGFVLSGIVVLRMTRRSYLGTLSKGALRPLGWKPASVRTLALAALCGLVVALLYLTLITHAPAKTSQLGPLARVVSVSLWSKAGWAVMAIAIAPPCEEFLFRGVLLSGFARNWGPYASSVSVTVLFVLVHITEIGHYWPAALVISVMAIANLAARVLTGSLAPAVTLHVAYNIGIVVAAYR